MVRSPPAGADTRKTKTKKDSRSTSPVWIRSSGRYRLLGRVGLVSRGLVYLLVGALALMVVLQQPGGRTTDTRGAMRSLGHEPVGQIVLPIVAAGLFCHALWRLLQAIYDPDNFGRGWLGVGVRLGQITGAAIYTALGVYAINLVFLFTQNPAHASERHLVRWMFSWPLGDWAVGVVGLGIAAFGIGQMVFAWREGFRAFMTIPPERGHWVLPLCKYGLTARGLVFAIIGWFFINAALKHSPREAGGFKEAWAALRAQPHGDWVVGCVALGFIAYAFYCAIEAAYRKV